MSYTKTPILPGNIYHLFNHANGNQNLFRNEENYKYFLKRYSFYMPDYFELFSYCLMPNHFHMLVRVKEYQSEVRGIKIPDEAAYVKKTTNALKNWLVSYTNSYNKVFNEKGNLFRQKIRRVLVTDDEYFKNLIVYIHMNPVYHNFKINVKDWKFSSYHRYLESDDDLVDVPYVLDCFNDLDNFVFTHKSKNLEYIAKRYDLDY